MRATVRRDAMHRVSTVSFCAVCAWRTNRREHTDNGGKGRQFLTHYL